MKTKQSLKIIAAVIMVLIGSGFLAYPQVTRLQAMKAQQRIESEMTAATTGEPPSGSPVVVVPDTGKESEKTWEPFLISIPKLGVRAWVVHGITKADLALGPAHYPGTALPGQDNNVAIAGHRTGYGEWFRYIDLLRPGDKVFIKSEEKTYLYLVEFSQVVEPNDWRPINPTLYPALTLTTCDPPRVNSMRLIVRARLSGDAIMENKVLPQASK